MQKKLENHWVAQSFLEGAAQYQQHAYQQQQIATLLAARLLPYLRDKPLRRGLELGAGTGFLTARLREGFIKAELPPLDCFYLNDLNHITYQDAPALTVVPLVGDMASIALPDALDLVVSSSALQWLDDVPSFLRRLSLRQQGILAIALFVGDHYLELKQTLGISLAYQTPSALLAALPSDWQLLYQRRWRRTRYFADVRAVMAHIKQTGVPRLPVDFARLRQLPKRYAALKTRAGYPLTEDVFWLIAQKK